MKIPAAIFLLPMAFSPNLYAQKLELLWQSDTIFRVPESVLYDAGRQMLYISNIDGASNAKDGKGHIDKLRPDGRVVERNWVTGLNAPKGMAQYDNYLYIADLDAIVTFDKRTKLQVDRIEIPGAKFLNDMTVDEIGTLYVSDSETGIIHKIVAGNATPVVTGRKRPNGVLWYNGRLYFVDSGAFYFLDKDGNAQEIARGMEASTDGIEAVDDDRFLISSWIGAIYLVHLDGTVKPLLMTKDEKINSADIGYDPVRRTVFVPTFSSNRVVAYRLVLDENE